eukprot:CAMPEP_0115868028 /NCGR_PEP_ID=MMETSP0287-20121206/21073_1 /TAXON_ID=412157 /ORGANISM="Chrysochromulina rotalis, Strain UIO044" /LENGTH=423 /DNA_ID=CAMNT_0003322653 /DNA_START=21 /DNA_END=1292 /DNA_ORIENTATION=-
MLALWFGAYALAYVAPEVGVLTAGSPTAYSVKVCKPVDGSVSPKQHAQVNYRLGAAATGQPLLPEGQQVPLTCEVYAGCDPNSCQGMPSQIPMNFDTDDNGAGVSSVSNNTMYTFGHARLVGDLNVGIVPNPTAYAAACSTRGGTKHAMKRDGIFAGGINGHTSLAKMLVKQGLEGLLVEADKAVSDILSAEYEGMVEPSKHFEFSKVGEEPAQDEYTQRKCFLRFDSDDVHQPSISLGAQGVVVLGPMQPVVETIWQLKRYENYVPIMTSFDFSFCPASEGNLTNLMDQFGIAMNFLRYCSSAVPDPNAPSSAYQLERVLKSSQDEYASMCNEKLEAERMYLLLSSYQAAVKAASPPAPPPAMSWDDFVMSMPNRKPHTVKPYFTQGHAPPPPIAPPGYCKCNPDLVQNGQLFSDLCCGHNL